MNVEALIAEVEAGRAVVVLGSGVTAFTTKGAPAGSWLGLIRDGVEFAAARAGKDLEWSNWVESDLKLMSSQSNALISAAEKVTDALGGPSSPLYLEWLTAAVGDLSVIDDRLILALEGLQCPITTTNYDLLYEQVTGRLPCTWQDRQFAVKALRGSSTDVLHWHGDWRKPHSVILGAQSYGAVIADDGAQDLQRAAGMMSSLVFVGMGSGLADPNFGKLVQWIAETAPGARHFRLCLESEFQALTQNAGPVEPVAFGRAHDDLVPFLESLSAAGAVEKRQWAAAATHSIDAIDQRVRSQLIIAEQIEHPDLRLLSELLVPPVLLPIPPDQFAVPQPSLDDGPSKLAPRDAAIEAMRDCITVVVGDELAGLTTALQWFLQYRASNFGSGTPVFLDYLSLTAGSRPLEREIRKQLKPWIVGGGRADADLPGLVLGLDNTSSRPTKIFHRMVQDLSTLPWASVFVGCRSGAEVEILTAIKEAGHDVQVLYLGPLSARDIQKLARIARPTAAKEVTRQAIGIANREHLGRTPFTMSLLISALLSNEMFAASASETTLLDAYVSLLLGRGDPHDDARFDFDAVEREVMLSRLAGHMVEQEAGSIAESDAISVLQSYFVSVDWVEDPLDVLANLRSRRIISTRQGQIRFVQSSFLHLFAAKYAAQSPDFRAMIFKRPLFYGPIVKHYAALQRGDHDVIRVVGALLSPESPSLDPTGAFADWGSAPGASIDIDRFLSPADAIDNTALPEETSSGAYEEQEDDLGDSGFLDIGLYSGRDLEPFPLARYEDMPPLQQVITAVHLVSNVLRDSELVTDLELKTTVLINVFGMWADFARLLETDQDYQQFMRGFVNLIAEAVTSSETQRASAVDDVMVSLGAIGAYGGMAAALSSRKLFRTVQRAVSDERMVAFPAGQILAALFALDVLAPGFGALILEVTQNHPNTPAVSILLHRLTFSVYLRVELGREDEVAVRSALAFVLGRRRPDVSKQAVDQRLRELRKHALNGPRVAVNGHVSVAVPDELNGIEYGTDSASGPESIDPK